MCSGPTPTAKRRKLEDAVEGELMNPTETVRAAVCAYAVGVGKPKRPSTRVIRQASKRQVVLLSFEVSCYLPRRPPDGTIGLHVK